MILYRRNRNLTMNLFYGLLTFMMVHRLCVGCTLAEKSIDWAGYTWFVRDDHNSGPASDDPVSISQISPKSNTVNENSEQPNIQISTNLELLHSIDSSQLLQQDSTTDDHNADINQSESDSDHNHIRIVRSASPILHDISSKSSFDQQNKQFEQLESNDVESSGRYFNFIQPTSTVKDAVELGDMTQSERTGKDLTLDSFLAKGGPRSITSGSPISPTSVTLTSPTAIVTNNGRQNPNPDIQDIITGIVKLLNGNVNVHANTQPAQASRRPYTTRINNRGPPRISEAQPVPNEYEQQPPTITMRPPPYPFDRPDNRPFINGVPLPEQIVPSMQQNYRPGFISQNRPPWQRPRPRPPITGNRRPIPPYKPIPTMPEYHPEDEYQLTTIEIDTNTSLNSNTTEPITGYEVEEQNSDEGDTIETDIKMSSPATVLPTPNKEDLIKKTKPSSEKKPIVPVTAVPEFTPTMTTIIQSTSEVNVAQYMTSTSSPLTLETSNGVLESSFKESSSSIQSSAVTPFLKPASKSELSNQALTQAPVLVASTSSSPLSKPIVTSDSSFPYHPRPGLVLDDPEFKPGGHRQRPQIQPTRPVTPPGYGEIFDVTLSAIQGPSGSGSQQTIKIKPYGHTGNGNGDIIVSPAGDDGFVSIDGKRTYINLFGESTDAPTISITPSVTTSTSSSIVKPSLTLAPGVIGTGYAVPETEVQIKPTQKPGIQHRPQYRPRPPQQPPVRIDTCIVGDDSTCDAAQNERCKTEIGVSSCHCRPGYARRKHREPCRRVVSLLMSLRVDKYYERRIVWDKLLADTNSEAYAQLSYESIRAIDSAMSMTPFSDEFMVARVNKIYNGDAAQGAAGVFVNLTLELEENGDTLRPNLKSDIQKHLLGVIHRRNNNIGNSVLYVDSPPGSVSNLQDLDECSSPELNDCHAQSTCSNIWGSFRCACNSGLRDPWSDQPQRAGRECHACPDSYCNDRGTCSYENGNQKCTCAGSYYGTQCEIDGEVLGVAVGASLTAVIIIVLTLVCLVMWSRRWHREQKNAMGSPVFGYMTGAQVKQAGLGQPPYQVTLEDRMRWAQIADVMAQTNHYAAEPVGSTRPSSAMFGYPNLHGMNTMNNMGTLGNMSMAGTLPMHATLPPVPLPRYGLSLHSRSNGMRTLENSSSSEEEDRADLLGRNFQVPRPKSRSNASITKQSGIYYDVDYEPSGCDLYGGTQTTTASINPIPGPQGIPMSTYTSGRAPSAYYMNK